MRATYNKSYIYKQVKASVHEAMISRRQQLLKLL